MMRGKKQSTTTPKRGEKLKIKAPRRGEKLRPDISITRIPPPAPTASTKRTRIVRAGNKRRQLGS